MKTYLITGASGGIGKELAEQLLSAGERCVLIARNTEDLWKLKERWMERTVVYSKDLRERDMSDIFAELKKDGFLPLDGLIHCAGVAPLMRIEETDDQLLEETYAINVFSFVRLMKQFACSGVYQKGASVVIMSSVTAQRGSNRQAVYAGSKGAVEATVRCLAKELLQRQIRVNAITSGVIETPMLQRLRIESVHLDESIKSTYPLGIIPVEEVCDAIRFLLSDSAAHITGTSFSVDSGYLL